MVMLANPRAHFEASVCTNPVRGCRLVSWVSTSKGKRVANRGVPYWALWTTHPLDLEGIPGAQGSSPSWWGWIKLSRHSPSGAAERSDVQRIGHFVEYAEKSYPGAVSKCREIAGYHAGNDITAVGNTHKPPSNRPSLRETARSWRPSQLHREAVADTGMEVKDKRKRKA